MDEAELIIDVPFIDSSGDLQWATIVVPIDLSWTTDQVREEIQLAIEQYHEFLQPQSDRLLGYEPARNNVGEYDYTIEGVNVGGEFFNY
jgi:hypothetical protein